MATANLLQTSVSGGTQNALSLQGDGVFFPKASTTSRLALTLTTTDKGFIVYETTDNNIYFWNGTAWESIPGSGDAGANGSVQYNDNGIVSGASNFTYNKATSAVSIAGALTVDTTTLVVDATNNRVGIGTASPQDGFEVVGNSFFRGAAAGVRVGDGGGYGYVSAYGPALSGAKDLVLQTGGGNVGVGVTPVAGSGAIQLNAGVGFPATQVASSDANTLDDYEEGTWTPVYSPVSGSFTTLPTVGSGKYRKIGDTVFFSIDIRTSGTVDLGGASGNIQITGFPFVCSSAGGSGTASVFQQFNLAVSSAHLGIVITPSTSIATISKNLSNAGASYVQANELSTATGSFENLLGAFGMYNV